MNKPSSSSSIVGIGCLTFGLMFFAVQDAMVKSLAGDYSVLQILVMRSVTAVPLLFVIAIWGRGLAGLHTQHPKQHAVRSVLVLVAFVSYYVAVSQLPLVDAVALFSAAPLFITALAQPVLGERVGIRRWSAVAVGFVGVLIMLRPGSDVFEPVALAGLLAALAYSGSALIARRLGPSERSVMLALVSTTSFLIGCGIGLLLVTILVPNVEPGSSWISLLQPYRTPSDSDFWLMMLLGLVTLSGFMLVPRAYQLAPASTVTPFEYTYLLWALVLGYFIFDEVPSGQTLLGAALVVASGLYIAQREARMAKG